MSEITEAITRASDQAKSIATAANQLMTAMFGLWGTVPLDDPRYRRVAEIVEQASQTTVQALHVSEALDLLLAETGLLDRDEGQE